MQALIDFLLSIPAVQARLVALGWRRPVTTDGAGGPGPVDPDA